MNIKVASEMKTKKDERIDGFVIVANDCSCRYERSLDVNFTRDILACLHYIFGTECTDTADGKL